MADVRRSRWRWPSIGSLRNGGDGGTFLGVRSRDSNEVDGQEEEGQDEEA